MNRSRKAHALAGLVALAALSLACGRSQEEPKPEAKTEAKPAESKAAESKPAEVKPAEVKPAEVKPAEEKAPEGRPPFAPTGAFRSADEAFAATMAFFVKVNDVVKANGTDCAKIGTGLKGLMDDQAAWTARLRASQQDANLRKEMAAKGGKGIEDTVRPAMTTISKCGTNPDVKAFLDGMQ